MSLRAFLLAGAVSLVVTATATIAAGRLLTSSRPAAISGIKAPGPTFAARRDSLPQNDRAALAHAVDDDTPLPVVLADRPAAPDAASSEAAMTRESASPHVLQGPMEDILYGGSSHAAPAAAIVALALKLFAHKLDLTRDLALGDRVRLVIERDGEASVLDYAELDGARGRVRAYRIGPISPDDAGFVDETGTDLRQLLLRTPLAHPRLTSAFGLRLHPLLGYTRMHRGVDFGAPVGTPVLAAGDGVVESAGWAGDYGRLVRLTHGGGLETRYAHLSAFAPDAAAGVRVRQGQIIGWTGASGLATGPHLHFEVRRNGEAVNPAYAARLPTSPLSTVQTVAFAARRREIDGLLSAVQAPTAQVLATMRPNPAG